MTLSAMLPTTSHLAVAKKCGLPTKVFAREFARYSGMDIAKEAVLSVERKVDEENSNIRTASLLTQCATYRAHNDPIRNHQESTAERLLARVPSRATLAPWELTAARFENGRAKVMERARKKGAYPSDKMRSKYLISAQECHWMNENDDAQDMDWEPTGEISEDDEMYDVDEEE